MAGERDGLLLLLLLVGDDDEWRLSSSSAAVASAAEVDVEDADDDAVDKEDNAWAREPSDASSLLFRIELK